MLSRALFVYGFPSAYGGANTELHHQIFVWLKLGVELHLVPAWPGYEHEPLYPELVSAGVVIHRLDEFSAIERDAPVVGYCCREFLQNLDSIRQFSTNTVWINCMTNVWDLERQRMAEGKLRTCLYQNPDVRDAHVPLLRKCNPSAEVQYLLFSPFFDAARFPFVTRTEAREYFGCGRLSRAVPEKYAKDTLRIYEYFVAPKPKRGIFLGWNADCEAKIGRPDTWIRTAANHVACAPNDFYRHCEIVLQPTDTTENWPRVGMEALASGAVLIVDDRGGWRRLIQHGRTGWLCRSPQEFVYYASKMAFEPSLRSEIAERGRESLNALAGEAVAMQSWATVFDAIY